MTAFWVSLFFVLIAEMGDKTQLVALAYATRYTTGTVMAGVFGATLLVHLFSVIIGETASLALPVVWIKSTCRRTRRETVFRQVSTCSHKLKGEPAARRVRAFNGQMRAVISIRNPSNLGRLPE